MLTNSKMKVRKSVEEIPPITTPLGGITETL